MAVVPMKKVLICGLKKDRKGTLELLQRQGVLEISNVLQEDDMFQKMDVTSSKTVFERDRKSTRLNSSHITRSRMPSSA